MKTIFAATALATFTLTCFASDAEAFTTRKSGKVNPINNLVFEVIPRNSTGQEIWCGAADYAQRGLGASWQARVYVYRGRGPSETTNRRTAVQFTLDPQAAGITPVASSISINNFAVGESMSVQQAFSYCQRTFPF